MRKKQREGAREKIGGRRVGKVERKRRKSDCQFLPGGTRKGKSSKRTRLLSSLRCQNRSRCRAHRSETKDKGRDISLAPPSPSLKEAVEANQRPERTVNPRATSRESGDILDHNPSSARGAEVSKKPSNAPF